MQMVPVPSQAFGNFFEGDCYIILYVSWLISQRGSTIIAWMACVLHLFLPLCFSPDEREQGLGPVCWHPLLDRERLLPGRARCGRHLRHPAGRVPGRESGAAQGGAGQRVATVQGLLQEWPHVSQRTEECHSLTHTHTKAVISLRHGLQH